MDGFFKDISLNEALVRKAPLEVRCFNAGADLSPSDEEVVSAAITPIEPILEPGSVFIATVSSIASSSSSNGVRSFSCLTSISVGLFLLNMLKRLRRDVRRFKACSFEFAVGSVCLLERHLDFSLAAFSASSGCGTG